jgi:hypothetical protein
LNAHRLKKLRKALGDALEKAPRVRSTGERSFAVVTERVKDLASRQILEALVRCARTKLLEGMLCAEDVIGLRLYTGPLFVKTNFVLRNTGTTSAGTNYGNVIHAILSGLSVLAGVRHSRGRRIVPRRRRSAFAHSLLQGRPHGRKGRGREGHAEYHH